MSIELIMNKMKAKTAERDAVKPSYASKWDAVIEATRAQFPEELRGFINTKSESRHIPVLDEVLFVIDVVDNGKSVYPGIEIMFWMRAAPKMLAQGGLSVSWTPDSHDFIRVYQRSPRRTAAFHDVYDAISQAYEWSKDSK